MTFDLFYQRLHSKGYRFARWFFQVEDELLINDLRECLRSALLNRYPFILYCRDMIRFYELQRDFFKRRGQERRFSMGVVFTSTFYFFLWGMLEHLTIIAKWAKTLKIDERHCAIGSPKFWTEFTETDSRLKHFLDQRVINEWISVMAEIHAAAHRDLALPTEILAESEDSKKTNEEILDILKQEYSSIYQSVIFAPIIKSFEPMMIRLWRIKKMRTIAPSAVVLTVKGNKVVRDPVMSIDYDLQYLTAVMDAFLVTLFGPPTALE